MEAAISNIITDDLSIKEINAQVEELAQLEQEKYTGANSLAANNPAINDTLFALKNNEDGDAWLFCNLQRNRFCFDHSLGKWFKWNGHFWGEDAVEHIYSEVDSVVDKYFAEYDQQSVIRKGAVLNQDKTAEKKAADLEKEILKRVHELQAVYRKHHILFLAARGENSLGISGDEWDKQPFLLGCKNGTIDLETGDFSEGRPENYIRNAAPTDWKGIEEAAPIWEVYGVAEFTGAGDFCGYYQESALLTSAKIAA